MGCLWDVYGRYNMDLLGFIGFLFGFIGIYSDLLGLNGISLGFIGIYDGILMVVYLMDYFGIFMGYLWYRMGPHR